MTAKVTNGHMHEFYQKNAFSKSVFEVETSCKDQNIANIMRTAWRHFRAAPTHFRSRDVINVIFGKTAITPSFFKLKASSKN